MEKKKIQKKNKHIFTQNTNCSSFFFGASVSYTVSFLPKDLIKYHELQDRSKARELCQVCSDIQLSAFSPHVQLLHYISIPLLSVCTLKLISFQYVSPQAHIKKHTLLVPSKWQLFKSDYHHASFLLLMKQLYYPGSRNRHFSLLPYDTVPLHAYLYIYTFSIHTLLLLVF